MALVKPTSRIFHGTAPLSAFYAGSRKVWEPEASYLFQDTWTQTDDTHWDWIKWIGQRGGTFNVTSGKGVFTASGGPGETHSEQVITDAEILVKVQWPALNGSQFPEIGWRMGSGQAGPATSGTGYLIQLNGSSGRVDIFKVAAYTSVGNATDAGLLAAGTFWFRIRTVGTSQKVRWWTDGSAEPSTWQIDITDASYLFGTCCVRQYGTTPLTFHSFTITDLATPTTPLDGSIRQLSSVGTPGKATISPSGFTGTDLTWAFWYKLHAFTVGNGGGIVCASDGSANYFTTSVDSNQFLTQYMNPTDYHSTYVVTLDVWHYIACVRRSTGIELYAGPDGSALTKYTSANVGTHTAGALSWLTDAFTVSTAGSVSALKVWQAALTQVEIETERPKSAAQRTANLYGSWQYDVGYDYRDYSGNNRVPVFTGSLASGPKAPAT